MNKISGKEILEITVIKLFFIALIILTGGLAKAQPANYSRPNIIVITTDQQSANAMSYFMGNRWISTPSMDKLALQGMVFTNAYASNPICAPSRNSIITGLYPHTTGIVGNDDLSEFGSKKETHYWKKGDFKSMGVYFRDAGYQTAYFGKWHLNYQSKDEEVHGFEITNYNTGRGDDDSLPDLTERFLASRHDKPFLLFLSFLNPHDVCEWARFQILPNGSIGSLPGLDQLPPLKTNALPPQNESDAMRLIRQSYHNNLKLFPVGNYTNDDWRRLAWGYYRLIEKMDSLVGQVLASIKKNGYDKNTLIVFTSDHGETLGAHHFNQKTIFYEESSKVPLIVRYPGKVKPGINKSLVNTGIDILPTLLEFANIPIPAMLPGKSVRNAAENGQTLSRPFIVVENKMEQGGPVNGITPIVNGRMVRSQRYKYCLFDTLQNREELYDLQSDPGETINMANMKAMQSILKQQRDNLEAFALKNKDRYALEMLRRVREMP